MGVYVVLSVCINSWMCVLGNHMHQEENHKKKFKKIITTSTLRKHTRKGRMRKRKGKEITGEGGRSPTSASAGSVLFQGLPSL